MQNKIFGDYGDAIAMYKDLVRKKRSSYGQRKQIHRDKRK